MYQNTFNTFIVNKKKQIRDAIKMEKKIKNAPRGDWLHNHKASIPFRKVKKHFWSILEGVCCQKLLSPYGMISHNYFIAPLYSL